MYINTYIYIYIYGNKLLIYIYTYIHTYMCATVYACLNKSMYHHVESCSVHYYAFSKQPNVGIEWGILMIPGKQGELLRSSTSRNRDVL